MNLESNSLVGFAGVLPDRHIWNPSRIGYPLPVRATSMARLWIDRSACHWYLCGIASHYGACAQRGWIYEVDEHLLRGFGVRGGSLDF